MHIAERLLLYATAICAGVLLLFGDGDSQESNAGPTNQIAVVGQKSTDAVLPTPGKSEIVLHDQMGRVRVVIKVAEDGRPSIVLKGEAGQDALTAEAANDGSARVFIGSPGRHAELKLDAAGNSSLELSNGALGQLTASNARDGSMVIVMSGEPGLPMARLSRDLHGNAELRLGSAESQPAIVLAATRAGELQAEFHGPAGSKGQLIFADSGSAELSLTGGSGPTAIIRAEAAAAEIAVRGSGKGSATLRMEGTRSPRFVIMDSNGRTLVNLPPGMPVTERKDGAETEN